MAEQLKKLVDEHKLEDRVELTGTFCMGKCQQGVCVTLDDAFYSVAPDTAAAFFQEHILHKA